MDDVLIPLGTWALDTAYDTDLLSFWLEKGMPQLCTTFWNPSLCFTLTNTDYSKSICFLLQQSH
jgi:hypothetical protein